MADFFVQKHNIGIESLPTYEVWLELTNCAVSKDGSPHAIPPCITETELNTQVNMLIASLEKVRREATRILEKNPGGIGFKKPN